MHALLYCAAKIKSVRMLTKKGSDEPKGCAFIEFEDQKSHAV